MCTPYFEGIIDSTLREGSQAPGIDFDNADKIRIIHGLGVLGVDEIEVGVASAAYPELSSLINAARCMEQNTARLALWCRCREEDIEFAARCAPDVLSLSIPVSDLHLTQKLGYDRRWALDTLAKSLTHARDIGLPCISVGLEDATRADRNFLADMVTVAAAAGAARIRLADTVGIATPAMISSLVRQVRTHCSLPIGIHAHNDFGMATANSVAALEAGAGWADATVLGLGERAGNCRLEELLAYLGLVWNYDRYRPAYLTGLCKLVAHAADYSISGRHPVVGEEIFTCETGIHVHGLMENPETYEPFDPQKIGRNRILRFGEKTGKRAVCKSLAAKGISISREEAGYLVTRIRELACRRKKPLDDGEVFNLARKEGLAFRPVN